MALFRPWLLLAAVWPQHASAEPRSHLSPRGTQICTGMMTAFLQKGNVTSGEVECLVNALGDTAFEAHTLAKNIVSLFLELTGQRGAGQVPVVLPVPMAMGELAKTMEGLLDMLDIPMDTCVKGHARELLERAAKHLGSLSQVAGRLAANGQDIMEELSDAVSALKNQDFAGVGRAVGTAGRKALLSHASTDLLPEGPPSAEQLMNVSAGILQGFFGPGFELDLSSNRQRSEKESMNVKIDLHRCISKNLGLYRAVMSKAWLYFAEAAMQPKKHEMRRFFAVTLKGLPSALGRCGVATDQQHMLMESVEALGHVELRLRLPEKPEKAVAAAEDLRNAAAHWSRWNWLEFGTDLGRMLQGLALEVYPRRYFVTSMGALERDERRAVAMADEAAKNLRRPKVASADELARGGFTSADQLGAHSGLSKSGVQIVEGIVDGLLNKKKLSREELECLVDSVGEVGDSAEALAENLASVLPTLVSSGHLMTHSEELLDELTRSLDGVSRLAEGFMENCRGEAKEAFQLALEHLSSLSYVTGRLAANGADVNDGIDQAVASWKKGESLTFGREVGRILRKVLLSSKSKPVLPEGNATWPQLVNITMGMLEGFFGKGFELDISSKHKMVTMPFSPMAALMGGMGPEAGQEQPEPKRMNIHIDLHSCIKSNLPLFQHILTDALKCIASEEVGEVKSVEGLMRLPFLMEALMSLPTALQRCGLDEEQEQMLMEAVQNFHLHINVKMPGMKNHFGPDRAVDSLKASISDFSKQQWFALGEDLGRMLRNSLLAGRSAARTKLLGMIGRDEVAPEKPVREVHEMPGAGAPLLLAGAGAAALAAGVVLMRVSAAAWRRCGLRPSMHALEERWTPEGFEACPAQAVALE